MLTVFKYELEPKPMNKIRLPLGAEVLSVSFQGETLCLWASVDTEQESSLRYFRVVGTGHPLPIDPYASFIATACMGNGLVFHVFETSNIG